MFLFLAALLAIGSPARQGGVVHGHMLAGPPIAGLWNRLTLPDTDDGDSASTVLRLVRFAVVVERERFIVRAVYLGPAPHSHQPIASLQRDERVDARCHLAVLQHLAVRPAMMLAHSGARSCSATTLPPPSVI